MPGSVPGLSGAVVGSGLVAAAVPRVAEAVCRGAEVVAGCVVVLV